MDLEKDSISDIKQTEDFKNNLQIILSQTIIEHKEAEIILEKNDNDLVNSLLEILKSYKKNDKVEDVIDDPHKQKIKELRYIMKAKDNFFNKNKDIDKKDDKKSKY